MECARRCRRGGCLVGGEFNHNLGEHIDRSVRRAILLFLAGVVGLVALIVAAATSQ